MEDVATAEISRSQLWQWVAHGRVALERVLEQIERTEGAQDAKALFAEVALAEELVEFLTLPPTIGYEPESTKADEIALVLEEAIVSGELEPGRVLRQEELSERFDVSRTPIERLSAGSPRSVSSRSFRTAACACGRSRRRSCAKHFSFAPS